jgi:hypothetical protein
MKKLTANPKPEKIQWKIWGSFWLHANNSLKKKSAGANTKPNAVETRRYNNNIRWTGKSPNQFVRMLLAGGFLESSSAKGRGLS